MRSIEILTFQKAAYPTISVNSVTKITVEDDFGVFWTSDKVGHSTTAEWANKLLILCVEAGRLKAGGFRVIKHNEDGTAVEWAATMIDD